MEPVDKNTLVGIVKVATEDIDNAFQTTTSALTILTRNKLVESGTNGYKLTAYGTKKFLEMYKLNGYKNVNLQRRKAVDDLRLELMNNYYRKKRIKIS